MVPSLRRVVLSSLVALSATAVVARAQDTTSRVPELDPLARLSEGARYQVELPRRSRASPSAPMAGASSPKSARCFARYATRAPRSVRPRAPTS